MHDSRGTDAAWLSIVDPSLPEPLRHVTPACTGAWYAGDRGVLAHRPRIGIVGSRHPREEAKAVARRIARDVGRAGFVIVSGLAIGIDAVAHERALEVGAPTIAVLAGGLGAVHPKRNIPLAQAIAGSSLPGGVAPGMQAAAPGLLLSEYGAADEPARPYRFQERNRIIAALSDYLVVVQANSRSGSMGTANRALELGVPVGVVPSAPDDPSYAGSIELIQQGADAVVDGGSLFRRLEVHGVMQPGFADAARSGARVDPARPGCWSGGGGAEQLVLHDHPLASLVQVPRTVEELAELADMELRDARRMLLELEEDGAVVHCDDGAWLAADAAR